MSRDVLKAISQLCESENMYAGEIVPGKLPIDDKYNIYQIDLICTRNDGVIVYLDMADKERVLRVNADYMMIPIQAKQILERSSFVNDDGKFWQTDIFSESWYWIGHAVKINTDITIPSNVEFLNVTDKG